MNLFSPAEFVEKYREIGVKKCGLPILKMFLLACLSGIFIACAGAMSNVAVFSISNASAAKVISGLLFPLGLSMIVMTGAELFTGNCLITISLMSRRVTFGEMSKNLGIVYLGNLIGSIVIAALCAFFGQLSLSDGALAAYTIKVAAQKCAIPLANAIVLGILCNFLVCTAVMITLCAKDIVGKVLGAFIPITMFVICGFEHCVANMYYIPAGLFALTNPSYAQAAAAAGVNTSALTLGGFLLNNLLPVTIGNIIGGVLYALLIGYCHGASVEKVSSSR